VRSSACSARVSGSSGRRRSSGSVRPMPRSPG
jgi:hypothetical protein